MPPAALARPTAAFAAFLAFATVANASSGATNACRSETFEDSAYTVCSFDLRDADIRVFWRDSSSSPYRTFSALAEDLAARSGALAFAMNGGMYHEDLSPVGLLIVDGTEVSPVNTVDAPADIRPVPNFYKKPNGVFFIGDGKAGVLDTASFLREGPRTEFATQSGPMLVIDGKLHPAFIPDSSDRRQRNGVGVSSPTEVHFVISDGNVNFHDFARFFRDHLGCDNALFLDGGSAPGLYAPELGRDDHPGHGGYGPIVGVVDD
jgi:uncharacterized protein YigE (DUF2233 family)